MLKVSIKWFVSKRKVVKKTNKPQYINSLSKQPFKIFTNLKFIATMFRYGVK